VNDSNKCINGIFIKNWNRINALSRKPIYYYLNSNEIDPLSKSAFKGRLDISKEGYYNVLFDSLLKCKNENRPFYFYIFNELVEHSEGELKEIVAKKCTQYVKQFPCDFFGYFDEPDFSINVVKWTTFIGRELKDRNSFIEYRNSIDFELKKNCSNLQDLWKSF